MLKVPDQWGPQRSNLAWQSHKPGHNPNASSTGHEDDELGLPFSLEDLNCDEFVEDCGDGLDGHLCRLPGVLLILWSLTSLWFWETFGFSKHKAAHDVLDKIRQVPCIPPPGFAIPRSGMVYLGGCTLASSPPLRLHYDGFDEVLPGHGQQRVLWSKMQIQHCSQDANGAACDWSNLGSDGNAHSNTSVAEKASFGPYYLTQALVLDMPASPVLLQEAAWQHANLPPPVSEPSSGLFGILPAWQAQSSWVFNSSSMKVDAQRKALHAGDTRITFEAAKEGVFSAIGRVEGWTLGQAYNQHGTRLERTELLLKPGRVLMKDLAFEYRSSHDPQVWVHRLYLVLACWYGLLCFLWPTSGVAVAVNLGQAFCRCCCGCILQRRLECLPDCCDERGCSRGIRVALLAFAACWLPWLGSLLAGQIGPMLAGIIITAIFAVACAALALFDVQADKYQYTFGPPRLQYFGYHGHRGVPDAERTGGAHELLTGSQPEKTLPEPTSPTSPKGKGKTAQQSFGYESFRTNFPPSPISAKGWSKGGFPGDSFHTVAPSQATGKGWGKSFQTGKGSFAGESFRTEPTSPTRLYGQAGQLGVAASSGTRAKEKEEEDVDDHAALRAKALPYGLVVLFFFVSCIAGNCWANSLQS